MGSMNKFPSGLNNWVDSDKPERIDFVTDNEIIDENVMWKDDYDPNGTIAAVGGIEQAVQSAVTTIAGGKAPNNHATSTSVHGAATTSDWGHVRLVNSVSSTSKTDVPVAANVKAVNDLANTIRDSLNNTGLATASGNAKNVAPTDDIRNKPTGLYIGDNNTGGMAGSYVYLVIQWSNVTRTIYAFSVTSSVMGNEYKNVVLNNTPSGWKRMTSSFSLSGTNLNIITT